jgi:hypothetical protein
MEGTWNCQEGCCKFQFGCCTGAQLAAAAGKTAAKDNAALSDAVVAILLRENIKKGVKK